MVLNMECSQNNRFINKIIRFEFFALALIFMGIVISIINFINNRSLWLDEAMLALNIVNRSTLELFKPLDMNQVAPIGFLLIEKLFCGFLGNDDWVLRIFPLISFFFSIPLFYILSCKIIAQKQFALYSTAIYALNPNLIRYSSEVKQYMSDVFICVIIMWFTCVFINTTEKRTTWLYSLIGVIAIWISNIAVLVLFTTGLYCLFQIHKQKRNYVDIMIPIFMWSVSFVVYYFIFINNHIHKIPMIIYWSKANAFLPYDIFSNEFLLSLISKIKIQIKLLGYGKFSAIPLIIVGIGLTYLSFKNKKIVYLFLFSSFIHLVVSYFKQYPFAPRLILYLIPLTILIFSAVLYYILQHVKNRLKVFAVCALFIPVVMLLYPNIKRLPIQIEEIKYSMQLLSERIKPNENVYIYYGAKPAFSFYKDKFVKSISDENIFFGSNFRNEPQMYRYEVSRLEDIDWIVFSHVYNFKERSMGSEEEILLEAFLENGYDIIKGKEFKGSSIYNVRAK